MSVSQTRRDWFRHLGIVSACHLVIFLRLFHYLRNPSMWHDEAALVLNVLGKSVTQLVGPLFFSEAAPPLFLWIEKGMTGVLGDGTYALRLVPVLASCASLLVLVWVARRLLTPAATLWLVVLFGCSDRLLWHACEAKPYAVDVLVAVGLLFALTRTAAWPLHRQALLYAGLSPFLLFLSYPACFLLGGVALSLLPDVIGTRRRGTWLCYGSFLAAAGVSFLLLLAGPIHAQRDEQLLHCWRDVFPSWDRPWTVPGWWLLRLLEVVRYACEPIGSVLAAIAGVGAVGLWRSGQRRLVRFVLAPVALAGMAALVGQYPFGATRVMAFAAPGTLLLVAAGLPACFAWLRRLGRWAPLGLTVVLLFPVGQAIYRVGWPWPRADSAGAVDCVRCRCRPGEAIIGTSWEHQYYGRAGRGMVWSCFRSDRRGPPVPAGNRLWLVAAGKTAADRRSLLEQLQAAGAGPVLCRYEFERTTVYYLGEFGRETAPAPWSPGSAGEPE